MRRTAYTHSFPSEKYNKILSSLKNRGHKYSLTQIENTIQNGFLNKIIFSYI